MFPKEKRGCLFTAARLSILIYVTAVLLDRCTMHTVDVQRTHGNSKDVLSFPRFFNGFSETINMTTGEHNFGYSIPNNMSEYRMLHSGE